MLVALLVLVCCGVGVVCNVATALLVRRIARSKCERAEVAGIPSPKLWERYR